MRGLIGYLMNEKIQKVLANLGVGSRREIERWIREGRIRINQQLAKLGDRIDLTAKILIDGKPVLLVPAIDVQCTIGSGGAADSI